MHHACRSLLILACLFITSCKPPKYPANKRQFADGYIAPGEGTPCTCPQLNPLNPADSSTRPCSLRDAWQGLREDFTQELKQFHLLGDRRYQVPGGAIAVVWQGQVLFQEGFGRRALDGEEPYLSSTLTTSASLSKMITATTALRLVEEGRLDLDRPVAEYLKQSKTQFLRRAEDQSLADRITMRHLLTHSSGIPDELPSGIDEYGPSVCSRGADAFQSYFQRHAADPLWAEPGKVWNYSNPSYFLAAAVIEAITGESFEAASQRLILDPAAMKQATWDGARAEASRNFASGYEVWSPDGEPLRLRRYTPQSSSCRVFQPAAGLEASVEDYAHFAMALMKDEGLLSSKSLELLRHSQIPTHDEGWGYSFGFFVDENYKGKVLLAHDGAAWGYRSLFLMVPEDKFAIILFQNAGLSFPERLWDIGLHSLDRFLALPAGKRTEPELKPIEADQELEGHYEAWSYDLDSFTEARPAYLSLTGQLTRDPITQELKWEEDYFGSAVLKEKTWPQFQLDYSDPSLNLPVRLVKDDEGTWHMVSRSFVARRISR